MSSCVQYPAVGCVVEYFDANAMQIAIVLEEVSGKLRLMLPNRRETKLAANRVLPWISAPVQGFSSMSRDEMVKVLEEARARRAKICEEMDVISLWELAQGEVDKAQASFFAELLDSEPSVDAVAATGHALLSCRTHFRFVPPNFEIYDAETVARREEEKKKQEERDRFINEAGPFVRLLLAVASHKAELPARDKWPCEDVQARLEEILRKQMVDPDSSTTLWQTLVKGLNDDPLLSVRLLLAWGKLEPHHNYWLDKAGYDPGDTWWQKQEEAARALADNPEIAALEACDLPFVSIDGDSTEDIDDAFYIEGHEDGSMTLTLALACPALGWPFGSKFDSLVRYRGTSVYLPEGDYHMLPRFLGTDALSLFAGKDRPALVFRQDIAKDGSVRELCSFEVRKVRLAANLRYAKCQEVLDGTASEDNPSLAYADMLKLAAEFSRRRKAYRISRGAVILDKREPQILLFGEGEDVKVELCPGKPSCEAHRVGSGKARALCFPHPERGHSSGIRRYLERSRAHDRDHALHGAFHTGNPAPHARGPGPFLLRAHDLALEALRRPCERGPDPLLPCLWRAEICRKGAGRHPAWAAHCPGWGRTDSALPSPLLEAALFQPEGRGRVVARRCHGRKRHAVFRVPA